jgi:hypothetical protein
MVESFGYRTPEDGTRVTVAREADGSLLLISDDGRIWRVLSITENAAASILVGGGASLAATCPS